MTTNQLEIYQWAEKKKNEPYKLVIIYKAYKRTSQKRMTEQDRGERRDVKNGWNTRQSIRWERLDARYECLFLLPSSSCFFVSFVLAFSAVRFDSVQVCIYILGLRMYNINRVAWISLLILFYFFFYLREEKISIEWQANAIILQILVRVRNQWK